MTKAPCMEIGQLPNGSMLDRTIEPNAAGGYTYYSDECGVPTEIWDTALISASTLIAALAAEATRKSRGP